MKNYEKKAQEMKERVESYLLLARKQAYKMEKNCSSEEYVVWDSLATMIDDAYTLISEREIGDY